MRIIIENMQNKLIFDKKLEDIIKDAVKLCLEHEGFDVLSEISILIVDNDKIREMNKEYRNIDKATDVLSFPLVDMTNGKINDDTGDFDMDGQYLLLGDIVISLEKAAEQAVEYGHTLEREIAFLVTHGVFHLLGYDHESEEDESIMFGKQEQVLYSMGLTRQ